MSDRIIPIGGQNYVYKAYKGSPQPVKDARVEKVMSQLTPAAFGAEIASLLASSHAKNDNTPTRTTSNSAAGQAVREYMETQRLADLELLPADKTTFQYGSSESRNVVAIMRGSDKKSNDWVLVGAHYDSIPSSGPAPGVEDNGSGTAVMLMVARSFRQAAYEPRIDIWFVGFGAEEQGLIGSKSFLATIPESKRKTLKGAFIMDMVSHTPKKEMLLESSKDAAAQDVATLMAQAALDHTDLKPFISSMYADSDHETFLNAGLPAALAITGEWDKYQCYHQSCDTIEEAQREDPHFREVGAATARLIAASLMKSAS
eukprot:gnl/Spiro4/15056_TR8116_c0_g1_i2.p2 gnl/Spiro4/15056_TR8116_c0_g1~~gnl/Spiro4/15056_TR8116_c0_g1_i2.p2  ORF type:complete len:316 (-),score=75.21 gnl/Spiro4/15056_TR8116_c0_g1_i2:112-1059(-)